MTGCVLVVLLVCGDVFVLMQMLLFISFYMEIKKNEGTKVYDEITQDRNARAQLFDGPFVFFFFVFFFFKRQSTGARP
jgi:hypothetical protein